MPITNETAEGQQRRLEAAQRGARTVQQAFANVLTRKNYAKAVGIHANTLARWEEAGVVTPRERQISGIRTMVFADRDVEFGKRVRALTTASKGKPALPLAQAARKAKRAGRSSDAS